MKCPGALGTAGKIINDWLFGLSLCLHLFQRNCSVGVELLQLNSSISLLCILSGLLISSCWFLPSQPWLNAKISNICAAGGDLPLLWMQLHGHPQPASPTRAQLQGVLLWGILFGSISSDLFLIYGSSGTSQFLFSACFFCGAFCFQSHTLSVFLRTCWKLGWVLIPSEF